MKLMLAIAVLMFVVAGSALADQVVLRFDVPDGAAVSESVFLQTDKGLDIRFAKLEQEHPMLRPGYLIKEEWGKYGLFIVLQDGKTWVNPRLVLAGKIGTGKYYAIMDVYLPAGGDAKLQWGVTDSAIMWKVGQVWLGPGLNNFTKEGDPLLVKISFNAEAPIREDTTACLCWNCAGASGRPNSVRLDLIQKVSW